MERKRRGAPGGQRYYAGPANLGVGGVAANFFMRQRIASSLWAFGFALLAFVVFTAALSTAAIALGHAPSALLLMPALILAATATGWTLRGEGLSFTYAASGATAIAVLTVAITATALDLQARVYDHSFDGPWYHQPAVELLAESWNPWSEVAAPVRSNAQIQITHYPKTLWIVEATLYRLTDRIESVKAVNVLLALAAAAIAVAAFLGLGRLSNTAAWVLGLLTATGPIVLTQVPTTLVDGAVASLWVCGVAALVTCCSGRSPRGATATLAASCALLPGVKFSGLAAVVFLLLPLAALSLARSVRPGVQDPSRHDPDPRPRLRRSLIAAAVAGAVGAGFLGFNPYVTNWRHYGHPLAPRSSGGFSSFTAWMEPPSFRSLSPPVKTLASLFARSGHTDRHGTREAKLKVPFTLDRSEIRVFHDVVNPRLGGFGPLFSGALLLGLAGFVARDRPPSARRMIWIAASLLASTLLAPVGWIARFVPQLWLVPVLGAGCLLGAQRRPWRALGWGLIVVLAIDLALVAVPRYRGLVEQDRAMKRQLTTLAESGGIVIHIPRWTANRTRLVEARIPFTEVATAADLPCARPRVLLGSDDSRYCPRSAGGNESAASSSDER